MVTANSHRSTLTRFAMGHLFHHGAIWKTVIVELGLLIVLVRGNFGTLRLTNWRTNFAEIFHAMTSARDGLYSLRRQSSHHVFEDPSAVFVALELIEAGAGRREQNYISRFC
jgi:hypothetical protein